MSDLETKKFYVSPRDKHLAQLMEISGKVAFTVLGVTATLLLGIDDLSKLSFAEPYAFVAISLAGLSFLALTIAVVMFSSFHTTAIHALEEKIGGANSLDANADAGLYRILPKQSSHVCVFVGIILMLASVVVLSFGYESTH